MPTKPTLASLLVAMNLACAMPFAAEVSPSQHTVPTGFDQLQTQLYRAS